MNEQINQIVQVMTTMMVLSMGMGMVKPVMLQTSTQTYAYSAMMASWVHDEEKWDVLADWAYRQPNFWSNHMSGPLKMIAFHSSPAKLKAFCESNRITYDNFKVYVGLNFEPSKGI